MSACIPDVSKKTFATNLVQAGTTNMWTAKLYQNNYVPDHTTVLSNLTEANFSGYSATLLTSGTVGGSLDAGGRAVITWAQITWTKSGATGNEIYGYYVVDSSGNLMWVEAAASPPIRMVADGDELLLTPQLTDKSEFFNS